MTKAIDFIRQPGGVSSLSVDGAARRALLRVMRPLACSVAIHLGLGVLVVVAGSAALGASQAPRVAWLDLEPAVVPPPSPAPIAAAPRPRPTRAAAVEPQAIEPRKAPDEQVASPAPPLPAVTPREATPEPPPSPSVQSAPPSTTATGETKSPDAVTSASASADPRPSRETPEPGTNGAQQPMVASRPPEASAGGAVVRAARPRGGYQVRPVYPDAARRAGIQGTTLLRIHIEVDGRVSDVTVARSAGHQSLDEAAAEAVRRWRFEPALNAAGPVSMWAVVPVEFRISDRD
jgi:periplasmic protein TonB